MRKCRLCNLKSLQWFTKFPSPFIRSVALEVKIKETEAEIAEWKYQVSRKPTSTAKEQHRQPEKQSVLKHLREIQERNKQRPPQRQRKKSIDRDSR